MKRPVLLCVFFASCASPGPVSRPPQEEIPPLIRAIRENDAAKINALLAAGVDTELRHNHRSPLYFAVDNGDRKLVDSLLDQGFKPALADADHARRRGYPQLADYLEGRTRTGAQKFFTRAVAEGDREGVYKFLARGADPNGSVDDYTTALGLAAELKDAEIVGILLRAGADPNRTPVKGRRTPLARALAAGRLDASRALLAAGAAAAPGELYYGVRAGDASFLDDFMRHARPRPEDCERQLHEAENAAALAKLLACGADAQGYYGALSLSRAAAAADIKRVELLLTAGTPASPESLISAAAAGSTEVVAALLGAGAPIKQSAVDAARYSDHPMIAALLEKSIQMDAQKLLTAIDRTPKGPDSLIDSAAPLFLAPPQNAKDADLSSHAPSYKRLPDDKRFALVVGVESYQRIPNADYARRDADAVREHLQAAGWPAENIITLKDDEATKTGFAKYIEEWLPLNVPVGGTLALYWAGHGAPEPASGETYLVPWDGDPKFLKSTAYPLGRLLERLAALKAARVFLLLDACFSGAGGRSVLAKGTRPLVPRVVIPAPPVPHLTTIAAAGADEITGSLEKEGHGLFTFHFLDSLNALGNTGAAVTATALFDHLSPRVSSDARRDNRRQTPRLHGVGGAVFMESNR